MARFCAFRANKVHFSPAVDFSITRACWRNDLTLHVLFTDEM
jgi:hypothetical protein